MRTEPGVFPFLFTLGLVLRIGLLPGISCRMVLSSALGYIRRFGLSPGVSFRAALIPARG